MRISRPMAAAALLMVFRATAAAQDEMPAATERQAVLPALTQGPGLQSTSGRFSSLAPSRPLNCLNPSVIGRVVSPRLIQLDQFGCRGQEFALQRCCALINVLMNVALDDPRDAAQMIVGRNVEVKASFKVAQEGHGGYLVFFLIAQNAKLMAGDPAGPPAPPFTSFMVCQPPELNALARALGRDLCIQSSVLAKLDETGTALEAAARALVNNAPEDTSSESNPVTCHEDPVRSDADLSAIACARRDYWAWWAMKYRQGQNFTRPAPP